MRNTLIDPAASAEANAKDSKILVKKVLDFSLSDQVEFSPSAFTYLPKLFIFACSFVSGVMCSFPAILFVVFDGFEPAAYSAFFAWDV